MINFALPSWSWGALLTPAAKFHVPSVAPEGCPASQTRYRTPFCSTNAASLRTPWGSRTRTVMGVAWPRVVTGDGTLRTGAGDRTNTNAIDNKTATATTTKAFRTSHCSPLRSEGPCLNEFGDCISLPSFCHRGLGVVGVERKCRAENILSVLVWERTCPIRDGRVTEVVEDARARPDDQTWTRVPGDSKARSEVMLL